MDERQKRILASLVAGSALSLTLGVTASAEEVTNTEIQESISQTNEVGSTTGTGTTDTNGTGTTGTNGTGSTGSTGTGTTDTNGTGTTDTTGTGTTDTTGTGTTDTNGTGTTDTNGTGTTDTNGTGTTDTNGTGTTGSTGTGSTNTPEGGNANEVNNINEKSDNEIVGTNEDNATDESDSTDGNDSTNEGSSANEGNSTNEGNSANEGSSTPESTVASEPVTYTTPETTPAETGTTPPVVTVKGGALTAGDEKWDDENKAGLRFDKASGSVVMVNNSNAVTIQTDSKGVNLSVAGVNRISTLYADGDVNITGTGIVLIDSIDMLEGTNLNLLTNTNIYTEGSAAVFLKTGEGVYQLINGEVSGILDEEYTIPDGVMLVVPNGGTLDMRVTTTVKTETTDSVGTQTETHYGFTDAEKSILESDSEEEKKIFTESGVTQDGVVVKKSVIFSTPKLNIAAKSVLHIQEGGQLLMNAFRNETLGVVNSSTLEVSGILGLDGKIRAYQGSGVGQAENFYLNVKDTGFITGLTENGTLSGVTVVYEDGAGDVDGDTLNITGDGSYVKINNGGIAQLNTYGKTGVVFDDGNSIGNITAEEGGSVTFYATDYTAQMQVEEIDGDYSISSGYVKVGNGFAKENFKPAENGIPFLSNGGIMGQKETSVARLEFWRGISTLGQGSSFWKSGTLTGFGSNIDYSYLSGNAATRGFDYYEVFVQDGDDIKLYLLDKDSTQTLSAGNICQIRGVNFNSRLSVGNAVLNGSSDSGWSSGSGWRYNGSDLSMVNNGEKVDIRADGKGMNFSVAGLNRIGTLYADADVNFTGTGIVLIDSLDLKKGANLNLLNIKDVYQNGSAAVFLKNDKGEYVLINGSVAGILDEEYTIPTGITLIVPNGGVLDMRVTKTAGQSGSSTYSAPKLTVSSGAALEVAGQMKMNAFRVDTAINSSTLQINGALRLSGALTVYQNSGDGESENFRLNVGSGGSVTGNGTMTGVTAIYETGAGNQDKLNIAGDGSFVKINNGGISSLTTTGNAGVVFGEGASIGTVTATGSGSVTFYGVNYTDQMQANALSGSYRISSGYVKLGNGFAGESFSTPAQGSISFLSGDGVKGEYITSDPQLSYWKDMGTQGQGDGFWKSKTYSVDNVSSVDFSSLFADTTTGGCDFYEVYVQEGDSIRLYRLDKDSTQSLSTQNICQIRGVKYYSSITVGNTVLEGANDTGWTGSGTTGSGWRYDGSSVSMVNNGNTVNIKAEGKGVNLSVAGLNRIGTLYADGNVNFTGTGIVLIDSISMPKWASLNLLTNTDIYADGTGSAAVFLKTGDGVYTLINKNVAGILDETYTIPDGVTLVVPKDGVLDMRVTTSVTTTTTTTVEKNGTTTTQTETHYGMAEDERKQAVYNQPTIEISGDTTTKVSKSLHFTVPELNISSKAVLRIQQGAQLLMQAFKDVVNGVSRSSILNVSGDLELYGQIEATGDSQNGGTDGNLWLNVKSGGSVTGTGTITNATIRYETGAGNQDQLNIAGDGNIIELNSNGIGALDVDGKANLYYADNVTIGSVTVESTGENAITFFGKKELNRLNITNSITGNYTISSGYLTVNGNYANKTFDSTKAETPIRTEICIAPIQGGTKAVELKKGDVFSYIEGTNTAKDPNIWTAGVGYTDDQNEISFAKLTSALGSHSIFEVFTCDASGNVTLYLLKNGDTVNTTGVFLIRGVNFNIVNQVQGGAADISTGTSTTGSGVLGGSNAGSFTGGNSNGVLEGDRQEQTGSSGSLTGTNTGSTGSGILGGGSSLTGGIANGVLDGDRVNQGGGQNNTLTGTDTGSTGSGVLGSGSSLVGGRPVGVLSGSRKPPAPPATSGTEQQVTLPAAPKQEASEYDLVLKVTGSGTEYDLKAFYDGIELKELGGGTVTVEMEVQLNPGWNPNDLFAVFRDEQGKLVAVRVRYDARTGKLEFDAPMLGQFRLVYLDWDGTDYTDEAFLAAIAGCLN